MRQISDVLSAEDFDHSSIINVFIETDRMKAAAKDKNLTRALSGLLIKRDEFQNAEPMHFYIIADPSTRTISSFMEAIKKLGGKSTWIPKEFSSISKGETHRSTARTLGPYCECIIIRDDNDDLAAQAMAKAAHEYNLNIVIINAGCGKREHPTQMLIDLYSMYERSREKFVSGNLIYAFVGDISHSRTIHSAILGLRNFGGTIYLVGPESEHLPAWLLDRVNKSGITVRKIIDPTKIAREVDYWYFTRLQHNLRRRKVSKSANQRYAESYGANKKLRILMKKEAFVLHPLPHGLEYHEGLDLEDARFIHYQQADNGPFVRMALLKMIFAPHVDLKRSRIEYGSAEVSGYFNSIDIPTKEILSICATEACLNVHIKNNDWKISLASLKKKEEIKTLLPKTFCNTCRNKK